MYFKVTNLMVFYITLKHLQINNSSNFYLEILTCRITSLVPNTGKRTASVEIDATVRYFSSEIVPFS